MFDRLRLVVLSGVLALICVPAGAQELSVERPEGSGSATIELGSQKDLSSEIPTATDFGELTAPDEPPLPYIEPDPEPPKTVIKPEPAKKAAIPKPSKKPKGDRLKTKKRKKPKRKTAKPKVPAKARKAKKVVAPKPAETAKPEIEVSPIEEIPIVGVEVNPDPEPEAPPAVQRPTKTRKVDRN